MTTSNYWRTISVTALPQPWNVVFNFDGNTETHQAPVALLQENVGTGCTRVVLGIVNEDRAEIEAVDPDNEDPGRFGDFYGAHQ